MILGSDDLVSGHFFDLYTLPFEQEVDYIGNLDLYFFDQKRDEMWYWPGYTGSRQGESVGAGRTLSRKLLDQVAWRLWADKRKCTLDSSMSDRLRTQGRSFSRETLRLADSDHYLVDVKSSVNLTGILPFRHTPVVKNDVLECMLGNLHHRSCAFRMTHICNREPGME